MTLSPATAAVYLLRTLEVALVGFAVLIVFGALLGGMNVLATAMLGVIALFGLGTAVCLELLAVWPIRRRWGGEADG